TVEPAFARHRVAQRAQFAVGEILLPDGDLVAGPARPDLEGIAAAEADIEPPLDEELLGFGEAGELAQLGDGQRCGSGFGHDSPLVRTRRVSSSLVNDRQTRAEDSAPGLDEPRQWAAGIGVLARRHASGEIGVAPRLDR